MNSIPNELKINMNTNMPGYTKLYYRPNMCNKNNKSESIQFNPLVKLNSNIIKNALEQFKKIEPHISPCDLFTNKDKFDTVIVMHKNSSFFFPVTLDEATHKGYISNNINLTLKYLFSPRNVIFLKGEPYSVGAYNWTTDDWALEVKEKLKSRTIYPDYTISPLITPGEQQLKRLKQYNPNLVQGANYTPDKDVIAAGFNIPTEPNVTQPQPIPLPGVTIPVAPPRPPKSTITPSTSNLPPPAPYPSGIYDPYYPHPPIPHQLPPIRPGPGPGTPQLLPGPAPPGTPQLLPGPAPPGTPQLLPEPAPPGTPQLLPGPAPLQLHNNRLITTPETNSAVEELTNETNNTIQPEVFNRQQIGIMQLPRLLNDKNVNSKKKIKQLADNVGIDISSILKTENLIVSIKNAIKNQVLNTPTKLLQQYFKGNYYKLVNSIYLNFTPTQQSIVNKNFLSQTSVKIKKKQNLSKVSYNSMVESLNVIPNDAGGECFFIAVRDAINNYNYYKNNKITYNGYGIGNKIFTVQVLRTMVYQYISTNQNAIDLIIIDSESITLNMNNAYIDSVNKLLSSRDLTKTTDDIMNQVANNFNSPSYVVGNPLFRNVPINADFIKLQNDEPDLLQPFIAINNNSSLKLYIESSNYWADQNAIMAIYDYLQLNIFVISNRNDVIRPMLTMYCYTSQLVEANNRNNWDKYMFLYHSNNNHYELVVFNFESKLSPKSPVKYSQLISIYDKNSTNKKFFYIAPFYLILLMFGSCYIHSKSTSFLDISNQNILSILELAFNKIVNNQDVINTRESFSSDEFKKQFITYFPGTQLFLSRTPHPHDNINQDDSTEQPTNNAQLGGAYNRYQPYQPYQSYQPFNQPFKPFNHINQLSDSSICYLINIGLFLKKGNEITDKELRELKCSSAGYSIKSNISTIFGTETIVQPNYEFAIQPLQSELKPNNSIIKRTKKKIGGNSKNKTQKIKSSNV